MEQTDLLTPQQVGQRIRARRLELNLSMPELGRRLGVNKSTVQRYEADGVNPGRSMVIQALAQALQTTPAWLTGRQDAPPDGAPDADPLRPALDHCVAAIDGVPGTARRRMLAEYLAQLLETCAAVCTHYGRAMDRADCIGRDDGLRRSLDRYAIDAGTLTETAYRKEMQPPVDRLKQLADCLLDGWDDDPDRLVEAARRIRQEAWQSLQNDPSGAAAPFPQDQRSLHDATL